MKADSFIFIGAQKPTTLLGIPPRMFIIAVTIGAIMFGSLFAFDQPLLGFLSMLVVIIGGWVVCFRRNRKDHHFANLLFSGLKFWRRRPHRHLVAGKPLKGGA